jgi:hypothetical protein
MKVAVPDQRRLGRRCDWAHAHLRLRRKPHIDFCSPQSSSFDEFGLEL